MRKRAFFGSSKLMLPGAVIGAVYGPGFSYDLSGWRLVIDDEGNLFQEVEVWQWPSEKGIVQEHRREHVEIGQDAVLQLVLKAQVLGFQSHERSCKASITDMGMFTLSVRFGEIDRTVSAYGAEWLAFKGDPVMMRFMELWDAIHRCAPFPPK